MKAALKIADGARGAAQEIAAAPGPRSDRDRERLLVVDRRVRTLVHRRIADLPAVLRPGDVVVVNDAATVPASIQARTAGGEAVEVRLAARHGADDASRWTAVLFGEGSFRDDTDRRPPPPSVREGDVLMADGGLALRVLRVHDAPRLVDVALEHATRSAWAALYDAAEPVRYSYLRDAVPLDAFQTAFATRAWAVEMPSAARPLTWRTLLAIRRRGVELVSVTHAAGLSATGDPQLDALLPFPERYEIPAPTVRMIAEARGRGGRVVAVGTTVVRALEGAALAGRGALVAGAGVTDLRIGRAHRLRIVDGLLTNVHVPGESHHALMRAFADDILLRRAHRAAHDVGYLAHEFGDATLLI